MGGQSTTTQTQQSQTAPWAAAQPMLQNILGQIGSNSLLVDAYDLADFLARWLMPPGLFAFLALRKWNGGDALYALWAGQA